MSINPYTGAWNANVAAHLLRRTSFSARKKQILQSVSDGLDQTVEKILSYKDPNDFPLNPYFENDPEVAVGETWVNAGFTNGVPGLNNYRNRSLGGWIVKKWLEDDISIQEKLTLFWHNHFVTADVNDARFIYRNYSMMRDNALGDFKQMVKDVTIDPSMLRYLNGRQNSKQAPNENYARELLELFTIGKGPVVGDGDYTNYTEDDVVAMAKVLTGWRDYGHFNPENPEIGSVFVPNRHDTTTKTLSHRFDNIEISDQGEEEYKVLIDIIFEKEEVSRFIVRKLYRWFLHYTIDDTIEEEVIEPLAKIFRENEYNIKPVLETFLRSEHFYQECYIGTMIKSPIDFIVNAFGLSDTNDNIDNLNRQYNLWFGILEGAAALQQSVYNHPNVAGWKAYYQEPVFYRIWLNSVTLPLRSQVNVILWQIGVNTGGNNLFKLDPFSLLDSISDPSDINVLIPELADYIFPKSLNAGQIDFLKEVILEGLPDFEWNVEYTEYIANPDDENLKLAIENKLRSLFLSMTTLPEYQLS